MSKITILLYSLAYTSDCLPSILCLFCDDKTQMLFNMRHQWDQLHGSLLQFQGTNQYCSKVIMGIPFLLVSN